ncbi:hypothetical protein FHR81_001034 [Actinoalloteichus hoggarensis]|uniref:Uncharacterized protein n=1 Tax=Actinoalloteichus hoggarensis TaxID=1470176 RepID=A0A221VZP5_9PSEU|nr:hypothetical protein [Actinoalloteichus hoggarensis]ASO18771.1 hypothetical protein AHOG_05590 [Actinoalloteichus hoggarensis]MBB5920004.1 hypothetical protein [Actinoalloteichus hoggarensis]
MGCRDCRFCTEPGIVQGARKLALGLLYLVTLGVAWLLLAVLRLFQQRCPQCRHRLRFHARRADGSFRD